VRAEVSQPTRFIPLHPAGTVGGRNLWRCSGDPRGGRRSHGRGSAAHAKQTVKRVLVIDDERSIRMLCRVNLAAAGMDVLEAADGEKGLDLARRERPDLILLDVMLPGIDGWEVARRLAGDDATREIPIVFLTARADPADRHQGGQLGGVGYIVKPFDPVGIGQLVEDVLTSIAKGEREELRRTLEEHSGLEP
jgi:DNA-binding response OmpR family regulator